jgi:hypothetical protein
VRENSCYVTVFQPGHYLKYQLFLDLRWAEWFKKTLDRKIPSSCVTWTEIWTEAQTAKQ